MIFAVVVAVVAAEVELLETTTLSVGILPVAVAVVANCVAVAAVARQAVVVVETAKMMSVLYLLRLSLLCLSSLLKIVVAVVVREFVDSTLSTIVIEFVMKFVVDQVR